MVMERRWGKYLLNYYLPSTIIVMASWVSFVIPVHIVPGRMALIITLLLVLINLFGTIIRTAPPSHSPTAMTVWALCCILFVGGSLLVYAALLFDKYSNKRMSKVKVVKEQHDNKGSSISDDEDIIGGLVELDKKCLIGFPSCFVLFNIIYWPMITLQKHLDIEPPSLWE